jgi:hypothetical protein
VDHRVPSVQLPSTALSHEAIVCAWLDAWINTALALTQSLANRRVALVVFAEVTRVAPPELGPAMRRILWNFE